METIILPQNRVHFVTKLVDTNSALNNDLCLVCSNKQSRRSSGLGSSNSTRIATINTSSSCLTQSQQSYGLEEREPASFIAFYFNLGSNLCNHKSVKTSTKRRGKAFSYILMPNIIFFAQFWSSVENYQVIRNVGDNQDF